jgi:hypothetical protein
MIWGTLFFLIYPENIDPILWVRSMSKAKSKKVLTIAWRYFDYE